MAVAAPKVHVKDLVKPRLRGVIHQWSAIVAVISGIVLVALPQSEHVRFGSAIYALTIVGLFGISATYHRINWVTTRARNLMKRADHSMIFIFIAGTYTPLCLATLHGSTEIALLVIVWSGALGGVITSTTFPHAPRWVTVPLYVALGWVAVIEMPSILHSAGVAAVVLLCVGGLLYSIGAVCYGTRRPNPWPGVFGYHEVFHALTALAAMAHYVSVSLAVVS